MRRDKQRRSSIQQSHAGKTEKTGWLARSHRPRAAYLGNRIHLNTENSEKLFLPIRSGNERESELISSTKSTKNTNPIPVIFVSFVLFVDKSVRGFPSWSLGIREKT